MHPRYMSCLTVAAAVLAAFFLRVEPAVASVQPADQAKVPDSAGALLADQTLRESREANVQVAQYRRGRGYRRHAHRKGRRFYRGGGYGHRRGYRHRRGYYHGSPYGYYGGAAAAASIIGLTAGVIAGSALAAPYGTRTVVIPNATPAPYSGEWYRRCDIKYRSFRASDGTFLGYDGIRRVCHLP